MNLTPVRSGTREEVRDYYLTIFMTTIGSAVSIRAITVAMRDYILILTTFHLTLNYTYSAGHHPTLVLMKNHTNYPLAWTFTFSQGFLLNGYSEDVFRPPLRAPDPQI